MPDGGKGMPDVPAKALLDLLVEDPVALLRHPDERVRFFTQGADDEFEKPPEAPDSDDREGVEQDILRLDDADEHVRLLGFGAQNIIMWLDGYSHRKNRRFHLADSQERQDAR